MEFGGFRRGTRWRENERGTEGMIYSPREGKGEFQNGGWGKVRWKGSRGQGGVEECGIKH